MKTLCKVPPLLPTFHSLRREVHYLNGLPPTSAMRFNEKTINISVSAEQQNNRIDQILFVLHLYQLIIKVIRFIFGIKQIEREGSHQLH